MPAGSKVTHKCINAATPAFTNCPKTFSFFVCLHKHQVIILPAGGDPQCIIMPTNPSWTGLDAGHPSTLHCQSKTGEWISEILRFVCVCASARLVGGRLLHCITSTIIIQSSIFVVVGEGGSLKKSQEGVICVVANDNVKSFSPDAELEA